MEEVLETSNGRGRRGKLTLNRSEAKYFVVSLLLLIFFCLTIFETSGDLLCD